MGNGIIPLYKNHILTKDEFQQFNDEDSLYAGKLYLNSLNCGVNYSKQLYLVEDSSYYIAWSLDELLDIDIPTTHIKFKNKNGSESYTFSKEQAKTILGNREVEEGVSIDLGEFHNGIQLSLGNSITCEKPKYSVFQTLEAQNVQLAYIKLDGREVIDQGFVNGIKVSFYGSTISISAKSGLSISMPGHFRLSVECVITPRFSYLPVNDIGLSEQVDAYSLYQFNGETIEKIYTKSQPHLCNAFEVVAGGAKKPSTQGKEEFNDSDKLLKVYGDVEKDYQSSVSDSVLNKDLLNKLGISKIVIPRYKISENEDEYHFEGLSFPRNQVEMTTRIKETGQFCHNGNLELSSYGAFDAKYWSTTPHIYPEIVFNNTIDYDAIKVNNLFNSLRTHKIVKDATTITVDDVSMSISEEDTVICYIRSQGAYKSWLVPSLSDKKLPLGRSIKIETDLSATSRIDFNNIQLYDITNDIINQSFSASTEYESLFNQNPIKNSSYESLITTHPMQSINMPSISGANMNYDGSIISTLGTYSYETNYWGTIQSDTISLEKGLLFSNICTISNFQYITTNKSEPTWYDPNEVSIDCYVHKPKSTLHKMNFFTTNTWIVGSFPKNMGFFGNYFDEKTTYENEWFYNSETTSRIKVEDLNYESYYSKWSNSSVPSPGGNGTSSTSAETNNLQLKVGCVNRLQTDTFAMAIVIWRNGKALGGASTEGLYFAFDSSSQGYSVCGYNGKGNGNVLIPAEYFGLPVVSVEKLDHENIKALTSEGPLSIGLGVLKGNKIIEKIELYESDSICGMFTGYSYPDHMKDNEVQQCYPKTLTEVIFHTGIPYHYYFYNASDIKNISLLDPDLSAIGEKAFYNCGVENLTTTSLSNLTWIEQYAFYNCPIKELDLSNSNLEYIGPYAFTGCGLTELDLSNSTDLHAITTYCFNDTYKLTSITLPNSIYYIDEWAFASSALKSIDLSYLKQLNSIKNYAFASSNLEWISLPNEGDLKTIEHGVFAECLYLQDMDIPNTVDTLGNNVFDGCGALEKIWIPDSVEYMGYQCFWGCSPNLVIYCEAKEKPVGWHSDWNNGNYEVIWDSSFRDYENA